MCTSTDTYFFSHKQRVQLNKKLNTDNVVSDAVNQLYEDRKLDKKTNKKMFLATYEPLKQAVNEGYGKVASSVQLGTPNYEFLKQLQTNVASFAAFKNHAQIKEMVGLLKDENGNLRSKADFKKAALSVNEKYNGRYLDVEYDTAVRQARSAAQWQKALSTAKLYPNIKYLPSVAAHPRQDHIQYYGITRPINDPIWSAILPANSWGCKCSWEVTDEATNDIPDNLPPPQKGFDFNPGATGQVFDLKNCDYIKSVPPKEQPALIKDAETYVNNEMAANAPYVNMYASKSGTDVEVHPLATTQKEFQNNLNYARSLANSKNVKVKTIQLLPVVSDKEIREKILPGAKENKSPDYKIDGDYFEMKEIIGTGKNTIKHSIGEAKKQADNIILTFPDDYPLSADEIKKKISNAKTLKENRLVKKVWFSIGGVWYAD